jgi:hypothetical protein
MSKSNLNWGAVIAALLLSASAYAAGPITFGGKRGQVRIESMREPIISLRIQ